MKVTLIGGGSFQWAPNLISDMLQMPSLQGMHLVLEDIDPEPLPLMQKYAAFAAEQLGVDVTVETTTDQRGAVEDAFAVIVCISTGGFASMTHDLEVPAKHGIKQSVGDSVGPGGISRALRNIPILVGIGRDMADVAPDGWLLNITNPMTVLTRSVRKETGIKAVGLCHEIDGFLWDLCLLTGVPKDDIRPVISGINHFPVITQLALGSDDGMQFVRDLAADDADDTGTIEDWRSRTKFKARHALKLKLFEMYGALPAAGDRHLAEFLPSVITPESDWGAAYGIHLTTIAEREADQGSYIERVQKLLASEEPVPTWQSGEMVAPILDSLITGNARELPLNIPNAGQAAGLPDDVIVEGYCTVDASGLHGRDVVALPAPLAELIRRHVAVQELTVDAAVRADRDLALQAMTLDPLAGRGDLAETTAMLDELLAATAQWLPPSLTRVSGTT
jgi:alpha-galactosidase/6-phospho-beta-glucosidase family protein